MCGFCGEIRLNGASASVADVHRMNATLAPRGPDASGEWAHRNAALGHRRLKIIDVSEQARQPMIDSRLGLAIVYNGAIYNYRQLRRTLQDKGYAFSSTGDTEVILTAYHAWGERCVDRLNGMFAFAIIELQSGRVFVARDRLGIKPLYFVDSPTRFRFASSLPALLAGGGVDANIDPVALHHYMTFHAVVPPPRTILKGVRKLAPATTLTIEPNGARREQRYWQLSFERDAEEERYSFEDWKRLLLEQLDAAVERRLVADVPVGVLLSGGLDSSLVVALLSRAGLTNLPTFSIGFESIGGDEGNEFQYSDVVAERYATKHHRIEADSLRATAALTDCIDAMSEPMVSHDCVGFYLLSERVAQDIKVVQSGQGADEVFAGYHWYPPMLESAHPVTDYASVFFDRDHAEFRDTVHPRFANGDHSRAYVERHFADAPAREPVDKALHLDTTVMLVDDPVKRLDNMTMAWGLEARVPFLDHELVEFAARIPAAHKVRNGGKHILKEAARQVLPSEVIDRPKGYFPVPLLKHLKDGTLAHVRQLLRNPRARSRQLFNTEYVDRLLRAPQNHMTPLHGSKLWQIAVLEAWLQIRGL